MIRLNIFTILLFQCCLGKECFDFEARSDKIVNAYIKEMTRIENLSACGVGGRSSGEVNTIAIVWSSKKKLNLKQARNLIVFCAEKLCSKFNIDRQIRPYLHNYPFCDRNLDISICFNKSKTSDTEYISSIVLVGEKVYYRKFINNHEEVQFFNENYSDALKIYNTHMLEKDNK